MSIFNDGETIYYALAAVEEQIRPLQRAGSELRDGGGGDDGYLAVYRLCSRANNLILDQLQSTNKAVHRVKVELGLDTLRKCKGAPAMMKGDTYTLACSLSRDVAAMKASAHRLATDGDCGQVEHIQLIDAGFDKVLEAMEGLSRCRENLKVAIRLEKFFKAA